jgi:hypothetical protein
MSTSVKVDKSIDWDESYQIQRPVGRTSRGREDENSGQQIKGGRRNESKRDAQSNPPAR